MEEPEMQIDMFSEELVRETKRKRENMLASKKLYRDNKKAENPLLYWATNRVSKTRSKCKNNNVPFTLTVDWVLANTPTHCPLLGIEMTFGEVNWVSSASLDRKDPMLGYTPQNCMVISNKANRIKSDASLKELITLTENLKKYL
jgi:hypothetical protein